MASSDETSSYNPVVVSAQGVRPVVSPPTPKELVDKYSGVGLQFRVKFVGCENVSRKRGDAEAARYCLPTLRLASKTTKAHKPKAVLGLSLKGISLYDERSKSITRVPVDKITFVTHDPGDVCYFGCIIQTKESHTGFKMYCFKAEKPIAVNFVTCARELFDLMFKLRQAKKKLKEERERADEQTANQNPDEHSLPPGNAPPPSYVSVSSSQTPPDRPPPPRPNQPPALPPRPENEQQETILLAPPPQQPKDRKQNALDEWNQLEGELSDIAQDLNLGNTNQQQEDSTTHVYSRPKKDRIPSYPPPSFDELDSIFSSQPPAPVQQQQQQQQPNPISGSSTFHQPPPTQFQPTQQQMFNQQTEPSITMDLMEAINKPMPGTTTTYGMGMGPGMGGMMAPGIGGSGMGMGGPGMGGFGMGGPGMGGPGMGGPGMGGPGMGGPGMGGPGMGGPGMGGPGMGGPGMGGPGMGGPGMGGPGMGGPGMGGSGMGGQGMGQGNPFANPQSAPNNDIFSLPADPLLNTNFSQPLLPQSSAPSFEEQQPQKKGLDFSDLVTIARAKTAFEGGKKDSPVLPPPPQSSTRPAETVDLGGNIFGDSLAPPTTTTQMQVSDSFGFDDNFSFGTTTATATATGGGGFDDTFTFGGTAVSTSAQESNWISF